MAKVTDSLVHAMATKVQAGITIKDGKFINPEHYTKDLMEVYNEEKTDHPVSAESLNAALDFVAHGRAATALAYGRVGIDDGFKADKELNTISGSVKLGTTNLEITQHREWSCRNPQYGKKDDAPERIFKPGKIEVKETPAGGTMFGRAVETVLEYAGDAL